MNAAKGIGRYVSWALSTIRELPVTSPIYRRAEAGATSAPTPIPGMLRRAALINMILTKSQRRRINHGYVESGEQQSHAAEKYTAALSFGGEEE